MIRRNAATSDAQPGWILIPQIGHAHLAADLADAWLFDPTEDQYLSDLRLAIRHHDDGWADWDSRAIEQQQPLTNFDEMQIADSLAIWRRSIAMAADRGPRIGYLVAGHFCRLLRRFGKLATSGQLPDIRQEFLSDQAKNMDLWLPAWQPNDRLSARDRAEQGVSFVQMFDAISLRFCCAEQRDPWTAELPTGQRWEFLQLAPDRVTVEPWPFLTPTLMVRVAGYRATRDRAHVPPERLATRSSYSGNCFRFERMAARDNAARRSRVVDHQDLHRDGFQRQGLNPFFIDGSEGQTRFGTAGLLGIRAECATASRRRAW